ncbi:MAG: LPS export ABC transporter periplasmic protein LptC [Marinovum sp.]|nr:LPS export ABC transporter periplasmic protein LptC [Marinovum sp.]
MSYSALITSLKVLLPLVALGLLSTVFLLARTVPEETQLPYLDEVRARLGDSNGMRNSFYSGRTDAGDAVTVLAAKIESDPTDPDRTLAEDLQAHFGYVDGSKLDVSAQNAQFSEIQDTLRLTGDVTLTSSTGYRIKTKELLAHVTSSEAESLKPVHAEGPFGTLKAGKMTISRTSDTQSGLLLDFTDGVSLIYQRQPKSE